MKKLIIICCLCSGLLTVNAGTDEEERIICPGKGERCAYTEILGIKFWSKKDKGAPGVIIIQKSESK